MPWPRKTLSTQLQEGAADLGLPTIGSTPLLRRSLLGYLMQALCGWWHSSYDYLDWIALQSTPWNATDENAEAWGAFKGITRKLPTRASCIAVFAGNQPIPGGTRLTRGDGAVYTVDQDYQPAGGNVAVTATAVEPGAASSLATGQVLNLANPIRGVITNGFVQIQAAGSDAETDDALKSRYLKAFAAPAQGGSLADYATWTLAVPIVSRCWISPGAMGAGTVMVRFMADAALPGSGGFPAGNAGVSQYETRAAPATGDILTVADALFPLRPATALVYVAPPLLLPVPFTIIGLGSANTAANQAAIQAALAAMFLRLGAVGGSIDPETNQAYSPIEPSAWYDAIASVLGDVSFTVTSPSAPIAPGPGQLPVLAGPPTYVS